MENLLNLNGLQLFLASGLLIICGVFECFAGFKIIKGVLLGAGLFVGGFLGKTMGNTIAQQTSVPSSYTLLICIVCALILALVLSMLAFRFYLAGSFVLSGFITSIIIYSLLGIYGISGVLAAIISIASGIVIGIISMKFFRPFTIISTALLGSIFIGFGIYAFLKNRFGFYANAVPAIICAISGAIVQYNTTRKHS